MLAGLVMVINYVLRDQVFTWSYIQSGAKIDDKTSARFKIDQEFTNN